MAKHIVTCRVCKEKFDTNEVEWVMPSKNFYYHKSCYEDWQVKKNDVRNNSKDEDLWKDATYQYLKKDLYIPVDFGKFDSQWRNLTKKGRTPKGIYFTTRYFYEIEKGDKNKAQGGIGIIDYIYSRATTYWAEKERSGARIVENIEQQIRERADREQKVIIKDKRKKTKKINFSDIESLGD